MIDRCPYVRSFVLEDNTARGGVKDRLIVTPHAAWSSTESQTHARRLSAETAMLYLRHGRLQPIAPVPRSTQEPVATQSKQSL